MPSYRCKKLESSLHFLPEYIKFCCSCAVGPGIKIKDFNKINKKSIEKVKRKIINQLQKGEIPKECEGCVEYEETNPLYKTLWDTLFVKEELEPIKHIIIDHYKQCDCNCIYCSQKYLVYDKSNSYQLLPIIKQLYKNDMIDKNNLKVEFQGGNISCLNEFDELVEEFKKQNCTNFAILTNGIKYMPQLENLSDNPESFVCISLDCGTKETFQKIKNVDAFEQTIENIKKLKANSGIFISLKYIVINDNMDEIKAFLSIANDLQIKSIIFDIDYRDTILNLKKDFVVPNHYYDLFNYAEAFCKENNILFTIPEYTKKILSQAGNN